jgi:acyl-CoA synthetase (NDP forming)
MATGKNPKKVLLDAASVAVIGASPSDAKIGGKPICFLREFGFRGRIYPVNPGYDQIDGHRCYPDLASIEDKVDLAVIAVPYKEAQAVVEQCARKGVQQIIMFSSGYAETGAEGKERQRLLMSKLEGTDIRLLGPNSLGFANLDSGLIANFSQAFELPRGTLKSGPVGFVSQSGAFGTFIFTLAVEQGVGFKYFAVTGNESDITLSELMSAMVDDKDIDLVAGYIEGIRDGRLFLEMCEKARAAGKPVVVIKTGRTPGGSIAALSHTAAIAGADEVYQAVFRQTGVIRVSDEEEMLDVLTLTRSHKYMSGRRVGVLTMSGGAGVMLADAIDSNGLELAKLTPKTEADLSNIVPAFGSTRNPVDLTGQFLTTPGMLKGALECLMADPGVDAVVFFLGLGRRYGERIADTLRQVAANAAKPLLIAWTAGPAAIIADLRESGVPVLPSPTRAVRALASLARFGETREKKPRDFSLPPRAPERIVARNGTNRCSEFQTKILLARYGISLLPERLAHSENEAASFAAELGYPVALKVCAADLLHKTEAGAVALKLKNADEVRAAYRNILQRAENHSRGLGIEGVLVAPMAEDGVELIVGARRDPVFGPIIIVGAGGIYTEVLLDAVIGVLPLVEGEAHEIIRSLRIFPLLDGARGKPKADIDALARCIESISATILEQSEIAEIEVNPLRVLAKGRGAFPLDALMILQEPESQ